MNLLVIGDSLSFQGPAGIVSPADPRLYPQVAASVISKAVSQVVTVDSTAREGWTSRDGWWALTKDPKVFAEYLPRASALLIGVGGMDQLPALIPTYVRDSMPYIRRGNVRRKVRRLYREVSPIVIGRTGGLMRQLPQSASDRYLTRIVEATRAIRGDIPIVAMTPSPYCSTSYPSQKFHAGARAGMLAWGRDVGVHVVDVEKIVLDAPERNPDGLHWGWQTHASVGTEIGRALSAQLVKEERVSDG